MKKIKGRAVLGQWGITLVSVDDLFSDAIFKKEIKRLNKLGFSASIVDVEIEIKYAKRNR